MELNLTGGRRAKFCLPDAVLSKSARPLLSDHWICSEVPGVGHSTQAEQHMLNSSANFIQAPL